MQKYHINLTEDNQKDLMKHISNRKHDTQSKTRAKILMDLDESNGKRIYTTKQISQRHRVSEATISEVCKRYEANGVSGVLVRKKRKTPPVPPKVTGEVEAHIIATCCSAPPEGRSRWSMKMIANKIVLDGVIDSISDETVRLVLKKRNLNRI